MLNHCLFGDLKPYIFFFTLSTGTTYIRIEFLLSVQFAIGLITYQMLHALNQVMPAVTCYCFVLWALINALALSGAFSRWDKRLLSIKLREHAKFLLNTPIG